MQTKKQNIFIWAARLIAAIILLQTLFFKFSAAPVSIYIFTELGIEPWGRIGTGILELIASILILIPKTTVYGAILGFGLMAGALLSHLTKLGIEVQHDSGKLFILAVIVFASCLFLIISERNKLLTFIKK
ncbi:MAG: DoxX family protein [Pedobacter sp.]|nr:MAG: DoxX family protein [Pedobacter sp.]